MGKVKKDPPPVVKFAQLARDYRALSVLGRAGARRRKEIAAKDRERKVKGMLDSSIEMANQANEDICPID